MEIDEDETERPALHSWLVLQRQRDLDRCMSCHME